MKNRAAGFRVNRITPGHARIHLIQPYTSTTAPPQRAHGLSRSHAPRGSAWPVRSACEDSFSCRRRKMHHTSIRIPQQWTEDRPSTRADAEHRREKTGHVLSLPCSACEDSFSCRRREMDHPSIGIHNNGRRTVLLCAPTQRIGARQIVGDRDTAAILRHAEHKVPYQSPMQRPNPCLISFPYGECPFQPVPLACQ